ncbi:hypothetical protein V494_01275 [Pseudogymnoascus sp. VKM F-4513 (FW-928)]|nr:hypothetical protein V494_01275 [Pseudogymnoascus sp. VKM F-4513 (FW-928)]
MTMAIDHQQRQFGALNFDHMPSYSHSPHFTNPWSASSAPPPQSLYSSSSSHNLNPISLDSIPKDSPARLGSHASSMPPYAAAPPTPASAGSAPMGTVYGQQQQMLSLPQDVMSQNRVPPPNPAYGSSVSYSSGSSSHPTYATSTPYDSMGYTAAPVRSTYALQQQAQADNSRRLSQPSASSETTRDFGDAINASRGMIAMSQNTTPRNIYGPNARNGRGSGDSYGFPATHSTNSSISSSGTYPAYFGGSVDSSLSDYSNAGSDIEAASSRTLPRPPGFMGGGAPPAPSSMMGQFSSKVSSSAQKKHKCKVCDKRFTRPSSLQTHMYSHTGEKPFACEVEGCGRHFSVVSNLRRHRKVHKGGAPSEAGSDDHNSE